MNDQSLATKRLGRSIPVGFKDEYQLVLLACLEYAL